VGTCGRYFKSWITDLDRDRFEVVVYHLFPGLDAVASEIAQRADRFREFGGSRARPSVVAPAIRGDDLDILIYPELGMDVSAFALAALRLAPRQYAAWGHPVTTGHAMIDAYLSCDPMEPVHAEAHYTERLIRLPGIGTRYERPNVPGNASRAQFGLPDGPALLLCPQSLFKIHPENDALFAEILARNPGAMIVLFAGRHPAITDQFMRRLRAHAGAPRDRDQRANPRAASVPHDDYMRVNLVCDAMVDTLHWSGATQHRCAGLRSACRDFARDLHAWPTERRNAVAAWCAELIASDRDAYIALASRLTTDSEWRRSLAARIRAAHSRLFNVGDATARLQELLQADEVRAR
jgi:CRISPR-associated protein Csy1